MKKVVFFFDSNMGLVMKWVSILIELVGGLGEDFVRIGLSFGFFGYKRGVGYWVKVLSYFSL